MAAPPLDPSLGLPVSTRQFSISEMVERAWGSEFFAPDHRVYQFGGVRFFDSTDMGYTGLYSPGVFELLVDDSTGYDGNGNAINDETGAYIYAENRAHVYGMNPPWDPP
jgi:hypothetical protein